MYTDCDIIPKKTLPLSEWATHVLASIILPFPSSDLIKLKYVFHKANYFLRVSLREWINQSVLDARRNKRCSIERSISRRALAERETRDAVGTKWN